MRLVYVDEAGTGGDQPICVVAAVIVESGEQRTTLSNEIVRIVNERVPERILANFPGGFNIHAMDVFGGRRGIDKTQWAVADRIDFLKEILCLPFVYDAPIALAIDNKAVTALAADGFKELGLKTVNQVSHFVAFMKCMDRADLFLRMYLNGQEQGAVIFEDLPKMRTILARAGLMLRNHPITLRAEHSTPDAQQIAAGEPHVSYTYQIRHLVDNPRFAPKGSDPMLQLADVCAFAFRRYLSQQPDGAELVEVMLGPSDGPIFVNEPLWHGPGSSGLFNTAAYRSGGGFYLAG
jgi:hypothetical protein